jgi:3-deoxy-D-manno-octulosonic-acid transferase
VASKAKSIPVVEEFKNGKQIIVAGSTWHEDATLIIDAVSKLKSTESLKWIIVPHEIGPRHIGELEYQLIEKAGLAPDDIAIYSHEEKNLTAAKVLIVDTVGLLSSIYHYGEMAYIGGGFGKGIHNILEAAVYGMPVFFGPNYHRFNEAKELIKEGGAFSVQSSEEFFNYLQQFLNNKEEKEKASLASRSFVLRNKGATEKILAHIYSAQ